MNILIVGNGFDIAHDLPTTYKDFLKFIEQINRIPDYHGSVNDFQSKIEQTGYDEFSKLHKGVAQYIDTAIRNDANPHAKVKDIYQKFPNKIIDEIIGLSENNLWINRFDGSKTLLKDGWIDFESEISWVVQQFERILKEIAHTELNNHTLSDANKKIITLFTKVIPPSNDLTEAHFNYYKNKMLEDLNNLIRCFELYLEDCVRNIDNSLLSQDIYNLKIDKVLSFNYTDTYYRLYSCKNRHIEYDYIHGKSKLENNPANNMVLGIDEYLQDDERNLNIDYIGFKKYYQRIHKATGCIYKKWLEEINNSKTEEHHVYIFGHSLSITDKDVLKEILTNSKVKTTIFYYDSRSYGAQIAHLVQVLGQDALISLVYGSDPKIIFEAQKPMINRTNSEWQILNDRYALQNLYKFCNEEIYAVINRITEKIHNSDLGYFYDQRNVISLYDALICNYPSIDSNNLLDIAKSLYNQKASMWYNSEDWDDVDYWGISPCNSLVCKFINEINEYNMQKNVEAYSKFDVNNLETLYQQISATVISEEKVFELLDSLFSMFSGDNNVAAIWKCIYLLIDKVSSDKRRAFVESRISTSREIEKIRFKHLQDVIREQDYYENICKDMKEPEDDFTEH